MLTFVRKHKWISAVLCFFALVVGEEAWAYAAPIRGYWAARYDVWRGDYKILDYGLPPAERPEFERLLKERYEIDHEVVAFCTVSETQRTYVDSYDSYASEAAVRKFGRDIFKECWEEAQKLTADRMGEKPNQN
jgi:hypothetical protein